MKFTKKELILLRKQYGDAYVNELMKKSRNTSNFQMRNYIMDDVKYNRKEKHKKDYYEYCE